jgi:hypothetical protein
MHLSFKKISPKKWNHIQKESHFELHRKYGKCGMQRRKVGVDLDQRFA